MPLREVLKRAGVTKPGPGRRYVCFAGPQVRCLSQHNCNDSLPVKQGHTMGSHFAELAAAAAAAAACATCLRPQGELPMQYDNQQGGPGSYGTSIDMETALDPTCDVILAYKQNGEPLHPDHGYPVRLLIPGYIGGRMVKWLSDIEVTDGESNNYFHYNDNRVLPSQIDAEKATAEGEAPSAHASRDLCL